MEITRLQPFPLTLSQTGFELETNYILSILDDHATDLVEILTTSDSSGTISLSLPNYFSRYDDEYRVEIYLNIGSNVPDPYAPIRGELVFIDTLTIMRPYINPAEIVDITDDPEEAKMLEAIARAIINSITGGFMYKREISETVGIGNDYLSVPFRLNKIVQVYENSVLVYDSENTEFVNERTYLVSPD